MRNAIAGQIQQSHQAGKHQMLTSVQHLHTSYDSNRARHHNQSKWLSHPSDSGDHGTSGTHAEDTSIAVVGNAPVARSQHDSCSDYNAQ